MIHKSRVVRHEMEEGTAGRLDGDGRPGGVAGLSAAGWRSHPVASQSASSPSHIDSDR